MAAIKSLKTCVFCERSVYRLAARGLCPACYYREKRNGTPNYTKVRKPCTVDGCDNLSVGQGLCEMHYRRKRRHGVVDSERLQKWGHIEHHPMKESHRWFRRIKDGMVPEWADFWVFLAAVGERPGAGYKLRRKQHDKPLGPSNFYWSAPALEVTQEQLGRAGYMRAYRAANPDRFKGYDLQKTQGMSLGEHQNLIFQQGGVCAICRKPETALNPKTGGPRSLAVDHCHTSGHVRALLCTACNTGLGSFNDNPDRLRAAIQYLERHKPPS